uniref:Uncharacterized protein n=1 Tax=Anguilla anguilla TaxID=7936 RepID=A0A0E9S8T8_ANGAN
MVDSPQGLYLIMMSMNCNIDMR